MMTSSQTVGEVEQFATTTYFSGDGGLGETPTDREPGNTISVSSPPEGKPRLPSLDLAEPTEPIFTDSNWWENSSVPLADHPLLRGLLLELPPKGTNPSTAWLDRWFEATRSILELIYVQDR